MTVCAVNYLGWPLAALFLADPDHIRQVTISTLTLSAVTRRNVGVHRGVAFAVLLLARHVRFFPMRAWLVPPISIMAVASSLPPAPAALLSLVGELLLSHVLLHLPLL